MASKTITTTILEHPSVGQIHGVQPQGQAHVEQYLGIQYATLENAFARAKLVETYKSPIRATEPGPLTVADPKNIDNEHLLLQHSLPHPEYSFSATECLTLNVSAPSLDARGTSAHPLPVVVFIHGGGFVTGSANWPQWDLGPLVEQSVKLDSPVIAVGINYRLGPFGFLTSSALREAGFKANNGLDDQKVGLRWVQKHIKGFGGDPSKVTLLCSSAGAASGFFHLQSPEPLFSRLAAYGGSPLIQPIPLQVSEIAYEIATKILGIDSQPPADQVKSLLDIPAEELSAKIGRLPVPVTAAEDGEVVRSTTSFAALADTSALEKEFPGTEYCKPVLLGDGEFDGMVLAVTALAARQDNLATSLRKSLETVFADDPAKVKTILDGYGINESNTDRDPVLNFVNDIGFAQPAKATAEAFAAAGSRLGTSSFLAHFNMPNPWPGVWQGRATHALDIAILLGNYNDFLSPGQKATSEQMSGDLLAFANGNEPFTPYAAGGGGVAKVYQAAADAKDDESRVVKESSEGDTGRRQILETVAAGDPVVLDKLLGAFGLFLKGPGPK
ncbi:carboxylesterase [Diaporthe helianthi]|uniref:Carboxylesterase n=1 Tax=Diaporthe helianthi TaxID=158607 RepID=A0A2P5IFW4_DIAHE|nr:carboxylesterase [Diaporthe helianthi]